MPSVLDWWDGAELWLSGLDFVPQVAIVMPVALALSYGLALVADKLLGCGIRSLRRLRRDRGSSL